MTFSKEVVKGLKRTFAIPEDSLTRSGVGLVSFLLLAALVALVVLGCAPSARGTARTRGSAAEEPQSRFLLGGWVIPLKEKPGPFTKELRAFVISNENELERFLEGFRLFDIRGNFDSLPNADYSEVVVLAAYYLWLPLKGTPLSLQRVTLEGKTEVLVNMELEEAPGRESPYLVAPLQIVSIDREILPRSIPIRFVFLLNGEEAATVTTTLD